MNSHCNFTKLNIYRLLSTIPCSLCTHLELLESPNVWYIVSEVRILLKKNLNYFFRRKNAKLYLSGFFSKGTLMKHLEEHQIQGNRTSDDVLMYYTTIGWMMWNWMVKINLKQIYI